MPLLTRIRQSLYSFVTPKKPALRKPSPSAMTRPFLEKQLHRRPQTPTSKTKEWLSRPTPADRESGRGKTPSVLGVKGAKVEKKRRMHTPASTKGSRGKKKHGDPTYDHPTDVDGDGDLEGSTLVGADTPYAKDLRSPREQQGGTKATTPHPKDTSYIPDTKLIDKDLNKSIVRPDKIDEDELTDDEILKASNAVKKNDRKEVAFDFSMERAKRWADAVTLPSGQWAEAERDLFFRLAMRGFEPLVPSNWTMDFRTLPASLFAVEGGQEPIVKPIHGSDFRAQKFLHDLFSLGSCIRDRNLARLRAEPVISRCIDKYISWALKDANLHNRPRPGPVHAVCTRRPGETSEKLITRMTRKLQRAGSRYRIAWRIHESVEEDGSGVNTHKSKRSKSSEADEAAASAVRQKYLQDGIIPEAFIRSRYLPNHTFPVLTGLLISSSVVSIVNFDSDPVATARKAAAEAKNRSQKPQSPLRSIATFDFGEEGMDVWNGMSVAIAVMGMRKMMMKMAEEGKGEWLWEEIEESEDDVDA